ncbi:hypothetical protein AHiyo6_13040, partial [Arthrobacter sp. Hiyo6]
QWGADEARAHPEDARGILAATSSRASLVELMALSLQGDYRQMGPVLESLLNAGAVTDGPDAALAGAMAKALQAERLCALGYPLQGRELAMDATHTSSPRRMTSSSSPNSSWSALLPATSQPVTGQKRSRCSTATCPHPSALHGVLQRRGVRGDGLRRYASRQSRRSLKLLTTGLEALRDSDPQQMFRLCAAMAFYVAAAQGRQLEAERLRADYEAWGERGMHLVNALARDFFAAGQERVARDGNGIEALHASADRAAGQQARFLELNALTLALELGDLTVVERLRGVAGSVEGKWAGAVATYCDAVADAAPSNTCGLATPCWTSRHFNLQHSRIHQR